MNFLVPKSTDRSDSLTLFNTFQINFIFSTIFFRSENELCAAVNGIMLDENKSRITEIVDFNDLVILSNNFMFLVK